MEVQRKADKRVKMKASTPEIEWSPCPDIVEDPDVTWLLYRKTRQHTRFVLIRVALICFMHLCVYMQLLLVIYFVNTNRFYK